MYRFSDGEGLVALTSSLVNKDMFNFTIIERKISGLSKSIIPPSSPVLVDTLIPTNTLATPNDGHNRPYKLKKLISTADELQTENNQGNQIKRRKWLPTKKNKSNRLVITGNEIK